MEVEVRKAGEREERESKKKGEKRKRVGVFVEDSDFHVI